VIDRCFNPTCKKRLRYLRDGPVVRVIRNQNGQLRVEHFWLCPTKQQLGERIWTLMDQLSSASSRLMKLLGAEERI